MSFKSFEEIDAWKLSRELCLDIFEIMQTDGLRADFALKDQINRSSGSIMDNISEGFERNGNKEFIQHLSIAKGSAGEARSQLTRIFDRKYITEDQFQQLSLKLRNISGKLQNQITYLKNSDLKGPKYKP